MKGKRIFHKIVQVILMCLVIGSLFGGIVSMVMAGETGLEQQAAVVVVE